MRGRLVRTAVAGGLLLVSQLIIDLSLQAALAQSEPGRVLYVRQTVGDDADDGLSPQTAWQNISRLSGRLQAGDTVYVGPGLYREELVVAAEGSKEHPIRLLADPQGLHTGDPPGAVMITGAEPVDESIFSPCPEAGVYSAPFSDFAVAGLVEMDGPQFRYLRSRSTKEHLREGLSKIDAVVKLPSSYFYDRESEVLYLHTSDGKPPAGHEIEVMRRGSGITISGHSFIVVAGFTFRHNADAGIKVSGGSTNITVINNTSYGSRQGIRVRSSTDILVAGNTLYRNENSGVYFLVEATNGKAVGNTLYENAKGARWGSDSNNGLAVGNTAFLNHDAGIVVESTSGAVIMNNRLIENWGTQLMGIKSSFVSESNCFTTRGPEQLVADLSYFERFEVLADYREAAAQDLNSRQNECGPLPEKIEVLKLDEEIKTYLEKARKSLEPAD